MSNICLILTTTDNKIVAENIASKLVEKNLAKCVQIDRVSSYFRWENKISVTEEFRLTIKTQAKNYLSIEEYIIKNHNYQLPQIISIDVSEGYCEYLKWIKGE
ncbi:MAG: divalent-cation tolerance protein CutA [Rickettsiaceae bacterium]|nr:MAG: divalent-cation tolerance protein CutA [Rickettsiaceae bacterium]